jgi:hypothetical protein
MGIGLESRAMSKSVRLSDEVVRAVKVRAAEVGVTMGKWVEGVVVAALGNGTVVEGGSVKGSGRGGASVEAEPVGARGPGRPSAADLAAAVSEATGAKVTTGNAMGREFVYDRGESQERGWRR